MCCFSAKYTALRSKTKDCWLGIRIMCPSGAICIPVDYCASNLSLIMKSQLSVLVYYKADVIIYSHQNISPWYGWNIAHLALRQTLLKFSSIKFTDVSCTSWAFLIVKCAAFVCPSVRCKLFTFSTSSEPMHAQILNLPDLFLYMSWKSIVSFWID